MSAFPSVTAVLVISLCICQACECKDKEWTSENASACLLKRACSPAPQRSPHSSWHRGHSPSPACLPMVLYVQGHLDLAECSVPLVSAYSLSLWNLPSLTHLVPFTSAYCSRSWYVSRVVCSHGPPCLRGLPSALFLSFPSRLGPQGSSVHSSL